MVSKIFKTKKGLSEINKREASFKETGKSLYHKIPDLHKQLEILFPDIRSCTKDSVFAMKKTVAVIVIFCAREFWEENLRKLDLVILLTSLL